MLTEPPQTKKHLTGDPLRLVRAERDDDRRHVRRVERVERPPPALGSSPNVTSVMRVRAFGAMQLTVTP